MAIDEAAEAPSLYERIVRRDRGALARTYEEFGSSVWFAARRVGTERCADAVTEEVFLTLWRDPDRYDASVSLGSWLAELASVRALAWVEQTDGDRGVVPMTSASRDASWMEEVHRAFDHDSAVRDALEALPADECRRITLALIRQQHCRQVACTLHMDVTTAKAHMRDGLTRLASALRAER